MNGAERIIDILDALELRRVYSVPGAQTLSLWDALHEHPRLSLVVPRNEWDGVFYAITYYQEHGTPAVVLNTVGPGCVNELPALAVAKRQNIPVLCITPGQPPYKLARIDRVFQGLRQFEILAPHVKASYTVADLRHARDTLTSALAESLSYPRGPVRVEIEFPLLFQITNANGGAARKVRTQ